ncbi:MAG: hypothetical protein QOJ65_1116 [Fimbriimonadaceae bacterium]|jgi:tetratricopeptide (TPR) repeat protein|nr:hypothetical protein [Fimbriimonadaceae bacterium]
MPRSHYEILGIKKTATQEEIRTAYRQLVLKFHPDRSKDPRSTEIFIQVTQAYDVLSDANRRRSYDALQSMEADRAREAAQGQQVRSAQYGGGVSPGYPPPKAKADPRATITVDVTRLTMLFSRSQFVEAERLARRILSIDSRQPIPYAVLGDIERGRGNLKEAAKMYSLAVQMDPKNTLYQKRYEEIARRDSSSSVVSTQGQELSGGQLFAPLVGGAMVLMGCMYLAVSHELPFLGEMSLISTWTLGLVMILFLSGVAVGSSLATAGLLERLQTLTASALGRPAPTMTLGFVAAVSFWAAVLLYGLIGVSQRAFNLSTSRLVLSVAAATAVLSASAAANGIVDGFQVLLWGGNLVYLGSLCGWTVADSFRR